MRKRTSPDRIASILRDIRADLDAGLNVNQACRKGGIGLSTYYRWKALQEDPASDVQIRISQLEDEVGRLKHLVAELALDRRMLQEALKKKPGPPPAAVSSPTNYATNSTCRNAAWPGRWTCPVPASATPPWCATSRRRWPGGSKNWPARTRGSATGGSGRCWIARAGRSTRRRCDESGDGRG